MQIKSALGTAVVAAAIVFTSAAPASADLVTRCVGTGGAVTVPGDLVVPAGESCSLEGTTVEGRVLVRSGADLVVVDGTFQDAVVVADDGYFDATHTSIAGTMTNRGGYGIYLDRSELAADYRGRAGTDNDPFTYMVDTGVAGRVDVRAGWLMLDSSQVSGPVRGLNTVFVDVVNSTLSSSLVVRDNTEGAAICASEVDGDTSYTGNTGAAVQVGSGALTNSCDDGDVNYFGGNLTISNNTGGVTVNGNIIRGDLSGTGNDPAPTGGNNRVRGTSSGQFADLEPAPTSRARVLAQADRSSEAQSKVLQRRDAAVEQADAAGPADLV